MAGVDSRHLQRVNMFHPGAGGSVPYAYDPGEADYHGENYDSYVTQNHSRAYAGSVLKAGERFNAKIPPSYGGGSFFAYVEDVRDWET